MNNTTRTKSTLICTHGGRWTGTVRGNTYFRTLKSNHFLKFPELSIAVSVDVLDQLQERGVAWLDFTSRATGTRYRCTLSHFVTNGERINRGFGDQVRLPLTGFVTTGTNLQPVYEDGPKARARRAQMTFQGWR